MVKRLRHRPFTAVTGVQIPLESLKTKLDFHLTRFNIRCYYADVAQLAEQLICNQQVIGSSPIIGLQDSGSSELNNFMDGFPSGQRGQTVNLLQIASVVRIHLHPFKLNIAGWSSLEARRAHNPKVIGSNPIPATTKKLSHSSVAAFSDCSLKNCCRTKETDEGKVAVCYNEQK